MLKRALGLVIAVIMLLGVFGLTACNSNTLDAYKTAGKVAIETYAQECKDNYSEDNWTVVCGIVEVGKQAVDAAENKHGVDMAVSTAKEGIGAVQTNNSFPSVLENFNIADFNEGFFEENMLVLIPFAYSYLLCEHLDFYTVSIADGKMNFYIEVTDPNGGGNEAIDYRLFAVIIEKEVYGRYELGEKKIFTTYDFNAGNANNPPFELPPLNDRDWLIEIQGNSIEHRVSLVPSEATAYRIFEMTVISSRESLQEYFSI